MGRLRFTVANGLAAYMDFGVGASIASGVFYISGLSAPWYAWCIGGIIALVPDFDILPQIIRGTYVQFDHRQTLFHRPILMLPTVTLLAWQIGGGAWALIAFLCVLYHFLHDTGWHTQRSGIAWLYPLSTRFLSSRGFYDLASDPMDHYEFITQNWYQPSIMSVREITIGSITLALGMMLSSMHVVYSITLPLGVVLIALYLWYSRSFT